MLDQFELGGTCRALAADPGRPKWLVLLTGLCSCAVHAGAPYLTDDPVSVNCIDTPTPLLVHDRVRFGCPRTFDFRHFASCRRQKVIKINNLQRC